MHPRALVFLAPGFEEIEAITVIDILRRADFEVVTVGTIDHVVLASRGTKHVADTTLRSLDKAIFDIMILPGGAEGTAHLAQDKRVESLFKKQKEAKGWIGAICAAPTALHQWGLLEATDCFTCHPSVQNKMPQEGLKKDSRVVVSSRLITSQAAGTAMAFAYEIVKQLTDPAHLAKVEAGVLAGI